MLGVGQLPEHVQKLHAELVAHEAGSIGREGSGSLNIETQGNHSYPHFLSSQYLR